MPLIVNDLFSQKEIAMSDKKTVRKVTITKTLVRIEAENSIFVEIMEIGGVAFEIRLTPLTPINWFDKGEMMTIMKALFRKSEEAETIRRDYLQMVVFRGNQEIPLDLKEWTFFASMTIIYVASFMCRSETRTIDRTAIDLSRKKRINLSSVCSLKSSGIYTVLEEEIAMLESPKFGCNFAL